MHASLPSTFQGTSSRNDFTEALQAALAQAQAASSPDDLLDWELVATKGHYGGLHGQQQLTVTIRLAK